jgi:hypothetical protein
MLGGTDRFIQKQRTKGQEGHDPNRIFDIFAHVITRLHIMCNPPSTMMVVPMTKELSSDASHSTG